MEQQDKAVIIGSVLVAVFAGIWAEAMGIGTQVDAFIDYFTVIAVMASLGFIYLSRDLLGGSVARNLEVIGTGLFLYVLVYWSSYQWEIAGTPAWLGVAAPGWNVFFNLGTLVTFGFVSYGFYLFWQLGEE